MKRWTVLLMSLAAVFCLVSCGAEPQEAAQETEEPSAETTTEPKQEEPKEKPQEEFKPEPQEEPEEEPQEEPEEEPEDAYMALYEEVLDMYRSKVTNGASADEARFCRSLTGVAEVFTIAPPSLSEVGYSLVDLNQDGTPELIVSVFRDDDTDFCWSSMIDDLYTISNNEVVQVISSGERYRYTLAADHTINYLGFVSAFEIREFNFRVDGSELSLNYGLIPTTYTDDDPEFGQFAGEHWYSYPKDSFTENLSQDCDPVELPSVMELRTEISESEAEEMREQFPENQPLDLTPISEPIQ